MESGLVVVTVVAMIAVGVFIVLMDKAKTAASRAISQKVVHRTKFERGKHLLEGMTIDSAASSDRLLKELQTRVAVSDPPTGLAQRLYTVGRKGNRIEYVYGNKFGDVFRGRVVILEHGERSVGIFKVVQWHEQKGIIVAQDWMNTLFEQIRAVVVAVDPAASFAEGIADARLKQAATAPVLKSGEATLDVPAAPAAAAEPTEAITPTEAPPGHSVHVPAPIAAPTKQMNTWSYIGMALIAACLVLLWTVGVPADLIPVWLLVLGAGGVIVYFSTRAPRAGGVPAGRTQSSRSESPQAPAESASVLEASAPVQEPTPEEFELAAEELSVAATHAEDTAALPATPPSKLVPRIIIAVAALVILGIVGVGFLSQIREGQRTGAVEERQQDQTAEPVGTEGAPTDSSTEFDFDPDQLLGYAGEGGVPQYVDIAYAGGSEWYGGDVLLNFVATGLDGAPEFLIELPNSTPCFIDSRRVAFTEYWQSASGPGMIVFDREAVRELHVFTQGQSASAQVAGGEPAAGADIASSEGDTASFVHFVQDEGGKILINAEPDGERVYSRPSIIAVRSSEPFFEWAIPLSDSYEYTIGGRTVTGYELFEYISEQGLVRIDVVCDDGKILSIHCWEE